MARRLLVAKQLSEPIPTYLKFVKFYYVISDKAIYYQLNH